MEVIDRLWGVLLARRGASAGASYTRALLEAGTADIGDKLREEAAELADALSNESDERVAAEAADVIYHLLVALLSRDLSPEVVERELEDRFGTSGLAAKAARPPRD